MLGATHAIWGFTAVLWTKLIFPEVFTDEVSIWALFLSVYVAQLPDIDIPQSEISKNWLVSIPNFILSKLLSAHRSKETHSFFWTFVYLLITLPLIWILGYFTWILLWVSYFSHLVLDFFNPTGVPLFYIPFINPKPRYWSIYNFHLLIIYDFFFYLKFILYIFRLRKKKPEMKSIKLDWIWITTWTSSEKFWFYIIWILWAILIVLNYKWIIARFYVDSLLLASFPLITFLLLISIYFDNRIIKLYSWIKRKVLNIFNLLTEYKLIAQIFLVITLVFSVIHYDTYFKSIKTLWSNTISLVSWQINIQTLANKEYDNLKNTYKTSFQKARTISNSLIK